MGRGGEGTSWRARACRRRRRRAYRLRVRALGRCVRASARVYASVCVSACARGHESVCRPPRRTRVTRACVCLFGCHTPSVRRVRWLRSTTVPRQYCSRARAPKTVSLGVRRRPCAPRFQDQWVAPVKPLFVAAAAAGTVRTNNNNYNNFIIFARRTYNVTRISSCAARARARFASFRFASTGSVLCVRFSPFFVRY